MSDGWHDAYDSGSGGFGVSDPIDSAESGLYGAEADEFAFLRDEEALPLNESKWRDALLFLVDCSGGMQFMADESDLAEMEEDGRFAVKGEGTTIDTASPPTASHNTQSTPTTATHAAATAPAAPKRDPNAPQRSQFQMVLSVVQHAIRNKIICAPDDFVGVVFFGSRNLTAAAIRKLDGLADEAQFEAQIGSIPEKDIPSKIEMDKILWVCSSLFTEAAVSNAHKRIIVLTNNDTPFVTSDPMSRMRAVQKGRDLRDLDIGLEPLAIGKKPIGSNPPKPYNFQLFWKDLIVIPEDESMDAVFRASRTKFRDLMDTVMKKSMKKRSLGSIPLQVGGGVNIGVKLYCLFRELRKESAVFLDKETNERLETQTRYLDTNTGAVLKEYEIKKYYPYGGAKVVFSSDEMKQLKEIGSPGLVLMGFKPYDALKPSLNFKNSYFIFPDDTQFTDSSKAFKALLFAMAELQQIAICRLIYRRGSIPRFVALFPQLPKIDVDGEVITPPGMNLIFLPYADDIRKLRFDPTPIATDQLIEDAKKVVAKLTTKYLPAIQNPVIQKHYRVIQAIALDEQPPSDEDMVDYLQPDEAGMAKYAPLIQQFAADARALGEAAQAEVEPVVRKRKAAASGDDDGPKRPKKEEPAYEEVDWKQHLDNDTLKKLTVPILKVFCRHHKLPLAGSKAELLERVTAALFG